MSLSPVIMWFRQDLRLRDNPALCAAIKSGQPIIFLYILDDSLAFPMGGASRWWLHHSLAALEADLRKIGGTLIRRQGNAPEILANIVTHSGANQVFYNRVYEPEWAKRDAEINAQFPCTSFKGNILFEPSEIKTLSGTPFKVFTPFYKACLTKVDQIGEPLGAPKTVQNYSQSIHTDTLTLLPKLDWAAGFAARHTPGEAGAYAQLSAMAQDKLTSYETQRDLPAIDATSGLAAHLHFGEISARDIWHSLAPMLSSDAFLRQIVWRDFAMHVLHHFPSTSHEPMNLDYARFPWKANAKTLQKWQKGLTGYPIIDAGMRELWVSGTMHNRVRMIAASFLVKHLLQPWQDGAAWFWDCLVDADLANNSFGWQWVAGCGADGAPYFRVFNPVLQGKKFDPKGAYIRKWLPELAHVPDKCIHTPWEANDMFSNYPAPMIDLAAGRAAALAAYAKLKDNELYDAMP